MDQGSLFARRGGGGLGRRAFGGGVLGGALLGLAAGPRRAARAASGEPIRIGALLSTTGPATFLGDPQVKTLRPYVDALNAQGGVLGRPLQLFAYDDGSEASKANSFARRLVQQDGVDVIVGPSTTGTTMAILPVVETARVPTLSLGAASVIVEPIRPYVFKLPHSDRLAARKVLEDMKARGIQRFALLSDTGGFGKSGRTETLAAAKELGLEAVADESYGERDSDMTPQLTRAKAVPLQAVFAFGTGQAPAILARNHQQLGMGVPLYMSHGQASYEFVRLAGPAAEGVRMPTPALLLADSLPENDPQRPVTSAYKATYEAQNKLDVSTFGGYAYDGLMMALDAIRRAGSTDKAQLRDALEATRGFVGVSGVFTMGPQDHNGLDVSAFRMAEIRGGRFQEVRAGSS